VLIGASATDSEKQGYTALGVAVRNNKPDYVKMLLRRGVDPSKYGKHLTKKPLCHAAIYGFLECVRELLDAGVAVDEKEDA
jgi:ankyrin repeat protein